MGAQFSFVRAQFPFVGTLYVAAQFSFVGALFVGDYCAKEPFYNESLVTFVAKISHKKCSHKGKLCSHKGKVCSHKGKLVLP